MKRIVEFVAREAQMFSLTDRGRTSSTLHLVNVNIDAASFAQAEATMAGKVTHYGVVAMLFTPHRCARGIRYRVRLPSRLHIGGKGSGQEHYISAYASFFARDFDIRSSIAECGIEFVPRGTDPNAGAWSTFLNPGSGTTLRNGRPALHQRGLHSPAQSASQILNFEMLLRAPEEGFFSVNGAPFNDGKFVPFVPHISKDHQAEACRECFEKGVNARIAIGYNDERTREVFVRDFSIEVTQLLLENQHGEFVWSGPSSLVRKDDTKVALFNATKIVLNYGAPPQSMRPGLRPWIDTPPPGLPALATGTRPRWPG